MQFIIKIGSKKLIFDSDLHGLKVNKKEFTSTEDGVLVFDKTLHEKSEEVVLQMSTNTSTLIPAMRILDLPFHNYFKEREVIESQNNISFYWKSSLLAAFYNQFSTDGIPFTDREPIIRKAVEFLLKNDTILPLKQEYLEKLNEPCKLLGFYQGIPIFDGNFGLPKLQSRLGIHIGIKDIMISTPLDKYESDVYELAEQIHKESGLVFSKKKNRVVFPKSEKILGLFTIKQIP